MHACLLAEASVVVNEYMNLYRRYEEAMRRESVKKDAEIAELEAQLEAAKKGKEMVKGEGGGLFKSKRGRNKSKRKHNKSKKLKSKRSKSKKRKSKTRRRSR